VADRQAVVIIWARSCNPLSYEIFYCAHGHLACAYLCLAEGGLFTTGVCVHSSTK